jgi:hypothetical protein
MPAGPIFLIFRFLKYSRERGCAERQLARPSKVVKMSAFFFIIEWINGKFDLFLK